MSASASTNSSRVSVDSRSSPVFSLASITETLDKIDDMVLSSVGSVRSSVARSPVESETSRSSIRSVRDSIEPSRGSLARSSVSTTFNYRQTPHPSAGMNSYRSLSSVSPSCERVSVTRESPARSSIKRIGEKEDEVSPLTTLVNMVSVLITIGIMVLLVIVAVLFRNELMGVTETVVKSVKP